MQIESDWIWGLAGGGLIGLAGAMFLLINGRVMGASGLIGGLVDGSGHRNGLERITFLTGLLIVPAVFAFAMGGSQTHLTSNLAVVAIAGILVGIGTRLANGCTSGHGVCGISRFSPRGILASIMYIAAGAVTVLLLRNLVGWP